MKDPASKLRQSIRDGPQSERAIAFYELMCHPDATWEELLFALTRTSAEAEFAALRLHILLSVAYSRSEVCVDINFWRETIKGRGLRLDQAVGLGSRV